MAGETFTADSSTLDLALRAKRLLRLYNACDCADSESKFSILHDLLGSMGQYVHIDIDFHCEYGKNIHLGDHVIINMNCTFVDNNRIDIGNRVLIASDVKMYTARTPPSPLSVTTAVTLTLPSGARRTRGLLPLRTRCG